MAVRNSAKFFRLRGVSILDQLCFEELLLRSTEYNCVVVNSSIDSNAIVLGFSGKPLELLHVDKVLRDNLQVIRRFTGGGTVIVDSNTVFASLICNSGDVGCQPYPREVMKWTEDSVYGPVFRDLTEQQQQSAGVHSAEKFGLLENDYVWGDRKIGGNAQTITKGRWVHHTSFLWRFDRSRMGYLKMPSKRPTYRADRPHTDFLAEIAPLLPAHRRDPGDFDAALQAQVAAFFQQQQLQPSSKEGSSTAKLPSATSEIVDRFLGSRAGSGAAPIGRDDFRALYADLAAANPQFVPRTYVVEDLIQLAQHKT